MPASANGGIDGLEGPRAYETLLAEQRPDGVVLLTFNRPDKLNAFNELSVGELEAELERAASDDRVKAVILTGAGRGFCSGAEVGRMEIPVAEQTSRWYRRNQSRQARLRGSFMLSHQIFSFPKPVVAAVNGVAVGLGFSLALACDSRVLSPAARLGPMYIKHALAPDYGVSFFLKRQIGREATLHWLCSGDLVDAERARAMGIAAAVVPPERLLDEALGGCGRQSPGPPWPSRRRVRS